MALGGATTLLTLCYFPERMAPWHPNYRPPATPENHFDAALRNPTLHRRPSLAPWRLLWLLLVVLLPLAARAQPDLARQATELAVQTRRQWAGAGNAAATHGWHFDGTANYADTRGNNVWAYDDSLATDAPGRFAASTTTGEALACPTSPKCPISNTKPRQVSFWDTLSITYETTQ